jgi:capsular exopolysaccharide synthesis family protein
MFDREGESMGRVFDALRRASSDPSTGTEKEKQSDSKRRSEVRRERVLPSSAKQIEEELFRSSSIMNVAEPAAPSSASTAHTADAPDGSALPGGMASRAVGATLGAAGSARAASFVSYDISAARVEPHLVTITQPRSPYCEQFRSLRTRVLQAGEREKMRVFVITSSGVGEGKTLTALNLAWMLAQSEGVRALIIDSDLRQPCATDYLAIDAPQGLSDVLGGHISLQQAIVRLDPAGLYLLPGGQARHDVAELLTGPTFESVIKDARRMFDYVIIDAPPLGIFTDANVLISRADAALLVVRAGKTKYALLDKLLEQLPRERMLGVVLNRADEKFETSAYYYQRYYRRDRSFTPNGTKELPKEQEGEVAIVR